MGQEGRAAHASELAVRVADEHFEPYILSSDFSFTVRAYATPVPGEPVMAWPTRAVTPYRKCYGIDPEEFARYRDKADSAVFVAWQGARAVGHVVVSTNWNGYAYVDELAVDTSARRLGAAQQLLKVVGFWARQKALPGVMLETQNNNLAACQLYERCGYVVGGVDELRYRGIDPATEEVAIFWYQIFAAQ